MGGLRVSFLNPEELDFWAAAARRMSGDTYFAQGETMIEDVADNGQDTIRRPYMPSLRWDDAGPLIENNGISVGPRIDGGKQIGWRATIPGTTIVKCGKTPLHAAVKAYIASVYGETVPDDHREFYI